MPRCGRAGHGPAAPALRTPPADLTRIAQRHRGQFPDAEIAAQIDGRAIVRAHGSRDMPVWGLRFGEKFGGEAVGEEAVHGHLLVLIDYLKSIQQEVQEVGQPTLADVLPIPLIKKAPAT